MHSTLEREPGACTRPARRPVVAFGPEMPDWGSWQWIGEDTMRVLSDRFTAARFGWDEVPSCDVLVIVKHVPPPGFVERLPDRTAVVYCPVDLFDGQSQIAACACLLRRCQRIVVHCERLRPCFEPYARVETMDHPVKFVTIRPVTYRSAGYVLWVGVWPNLDPLAAWVNQHPLPCRLRVLTNVQDGMAGVPAEFGFRADCDVVIERWSPNRQLELTNGAKAALDIKGSGFRQRHKPPAKGLDFIASGLPLAMNPDSSTAEHLARMGFELAGPTDVAMWFSRDYWKETRRFGKALRELLSPRRIGRRFEWLFEQVLDERSGWGRGQQTGARSAAPRIVRGASRTTVRESTGSEVEADPAKARQRGRLLLSCVNSPASLIGYNWDRGEVFWSLPSERMKACGICYHAGGLLVASDNAVRRLTPDRVDSVELPGPHDSLGHSIHPIGEAEFGVIDTGHSCLRVFQSDLSPSCVLEPLAPWGDLPADAIHLNDFAVTPHGVVASCFDYRPWRKVQAELSWQRWCRGGYGLALNLTGQEGAGGGRVVGCGWNHPHSLVYRAPHLHLCSAATGVCSTPARSPTTAHWWSAAGSP